MERDELREGERSVHFIVRADRFQQNGFFAFVLNEAKHNAKVIACSARPGPFRGVP